MGRRLALDTGLLIAMERLGGGAAGFLAPDDDLAVPLLALAEYKAGLALIPPAHGAKARRFIDWLSSQAELLPYDDAAMERHASLLAWTRSRGVARGAHDLIIAAIAAANDRTLVSFDRRARFDELPGVATLILDAAT
jgi:tRNA(fMet)-specific endonuclease VapC